MNVAVVGYGIEGIASYEYFSSQGHSVIICDQNEALEIPAGAQSQLGDAYLNDLDRFDLVIRTAGMHPRIILEQNPNLGDKLSTQLNEFLKACSTQNIIGITGTKGKGTTSTLVAKMLEAALRQSSGSSTSKHVLLGGNIGIPLFSFLDDLAPDSWVVLELSSFQLIDLRYSPHIALCLMVVPEHLNWHADMAEYVAAKSNLFARQTTDDIAIYFAENDLSKQIASAGAGQKLPYYAKPGAHIDNGSISISGQAICRTDELKLLGRHNWQNVCAAVTAVWQVTQDVTTIRSVVTSFTGLPHRIEFVREVNGVRFYNDSFATGLHATEAAIEAIPEKKVMILGGFERMLPLEHFGTFAMEHQDDFRKLLLIGESAERLAATLKSAGFTNYQIDKEVQTMPVIVDKARSLAQPGDAIVLSPGFASFDMFKNFEERGLQFKDVVNRL